MDKKVIFIHGYTASSRADWYPDISEELDKLGVDYSIPDMPGGRYPHWKDWLPIIEKEVNTNNNPIVLVGHSLGTRAILLYLGKTEKVFDTVILIAPPNNNVEKGKKRAEGKLSDFWEYEIDLVELQSRANKFIVIHSRDDSVCDYEGGIDIAKGLDAELVTYDDRDHMSEPDNAPYVLEVLKTVL